MLFSNYLIGFSGGHSLLNESRHFMAFDEGRGTVFFSSRLWWADVQAFDAEFVDAGLIYGFKHDFGESRFCGSWQQVIFE